jgi:putative NADH-flavin reductase
MSEPPLHHCTPSARHKQRHFSIMLVFIAGINGSLGQGLANVAISRGLSVRGLGRNFDKLWLELSAQLESFTRSEPGYDLSVFEKAVTSVDAVIIAYTSHPVMDLDA